MHTRRILTTCFALTLALTFAAAPAGAGAGGKLRGSLERLLERLDLSQSKRDELRALFEGHRAAVDALATRELDARAALRDAVEKRTPDEDAVTAAAASLAEVERDFALERALIYSEVFPVLGDDQRVKLLKFVTVMEGQIAARERESALPSQRVETLKAKLPEDEQQTVDAVMAESRRPVASAMNGLTNARQTLTIAIHQRRPDEGLVTEAASSSSAARTRLALTAAAIWPQLLDPLNQKQRESLRKYSESLDKAIVERHRALSLFFLDQL